MPNAIINQPVCGVTFSDQPISGQFFKRKHTLIVSARVHKYLKIQRHSAPNNRNSEQNLLIIEKREI